MLLVPGMTLAIEPMITAGRKEVQWEDDDWTVTTVDRSYAAHYENTVLITTMPAVASTAPGSTR